MRKIREENGAGGTATIIVLIIIIIILAGVFYLRANNLITIEKAPERHTEEKDGIDLNLNVTKEPALDVKNAVENMESQRK